MTFELTCSSALERQRYFEQLCEMDELVFQVLWENSEIRAMLKSFNDRWICAEEERSEDIICPKCGNKIRVGGISVKTCPNFECLIFDADFCAKYPACAGCDNYCACRVCAKRETVIEKKIIFCDLIDLAEACRSCDKRNKADFSPSECLRCPNKIGEIKKNDSI